MRPKATAVSWPEVFQHLGREARDIAPSGSPTHRRILIPMLVGASDLFAVREGLIAHALRLRGARVAFVLCDGFPVCDARTFDRDPADLCSRCWPKGMTRLTELGLTVHGISSFVTLRAARALWERAAAASPDELLTFRYGGLSLGPHVFASTLRYFRAGRFDREDDAMVTKAREYLGHALVMTEIARNALRALRPDKVFSSHGIYASWGPWADLARACRVPFAGYGGGWRRGTLMVMHDAARAFGCDDIWERWRTVPLTSEEERRLDAYLASREDNSQDFYRYFDHVDRDVAALEARLGVPGRAWKRRAVAFTNVSWDAAKMAPGRAFADLFDWLTALVAHAERHGDWLLLVKTHPAERRFLETTPGAWTVESVLRRHFPRLPDNVKVIPPDDNISNFALYRFMDFGLVHTSTAGLEMALHGAPALTSGSGVHYEGKGIVLEPADRTDYFRTLERLIHATEPFAPDVALARRYAYTLYFRKAIPFEPLEVEGWTPVRLHIDGLTDLLPGHFPGVDALCEGILEDAPFAMER